MSTITVDLNELRTLLSRVIPFAETGGTLPVIESVYLQGKGNDLFATATDRYILGVSRTTVENANGFDALIKLKDVKHILSTFKSRKGILTKVTLTTGGGKQDGTLTVTLADADDLTARYALIDGTFPDITKIFREWEAPAEFAATGYNPAYLAKFAHVGDSRNEPIRVTGGGLKPTIVQAGNYFLGGIMPVRLGDVAYDDLSAWVTAMEGPKAKRRPARKAKAA